MFKVSHFQKIILCFEIPAKPVADFFYYLMKLNTAEYRIRRHKFVCLPLLCMRFRAKVCNSERSAHSF